MLKDSFCSYCGSAFGEGKSAYPKICGNCAQITYHNPLPVAIALLQVEDGILILKRNIEPQKGEWALPGGFIEAGETWQQAVVRELNEETGIEISAECVQLFTTLSNPQGTVLLIFGLIQLPDPIQLPNFEANEETLALGVLTEFKELAFPLHTEAVRLYFNEGM